MFTRSDKSGNCVKCGIWRKVLCRDHIIPRREGGGNEPSNIQWICANCHQDKTALEQSAAHKGRPKSAAQREKMSAWQRGIPKPQALRDKISATLTGRTLPPEVRLKLSIAHKGRIVSPETGRKISLALKGRPSRRGTECPHGHAYAAGNCLVEASGKISCRTCRNERKRAKRRAERLDRSDQASLNL